MGGGLFYALPEFALPVWVITGLVAVFISGFVWGYLPLITHFFRKRR